MKGKTLTTILAAFLILAIVAVFVVIYFYQKQGSETTITAVGTSKMTVAPDEALVYLLIQTRAASAEQAKNDNAKISDDVLTALIKIGLERKTIETENYNIYPEYNWSSGKQEIIGYVASNNMKIKTKDFNSVGKIIDASVDSGALVSYINFELSNEKSNEYKAAVLADASKDAKVKAEAIATGVGKGIGSLVSITASDYNYIPYPLYRAESGGDLKTVATNIRPKNLEVSASVTAVFKTS